MFRSSHVGVTDYNGLTSMYFRAVLRRSMTVLQEGEHASGVILDFGCGHGILQEIYPTAKIVGYDIVPELTDVADWRFVQADSIICNHVLCTFEKSALRVLIKEFASTGVRTLVISESLRRWPNRLGARLLRREAHKSSRIFLKEEVETISEFYDLDSVELVWGLTAVHRFYARNTASEE